MRVAPVNPEFQANRRIVVASFVAGVGAMVFLGLIAPVALKGGLQMASAEAGVLETSAPAIEPLDVAAIEATLAEAGRAMAASRGATDGAMARLERLSGR
jgi:hypothetical protein